MPLVFLLLFLTGCQLFAPQFPVPPELPPAHRQTGGSLAVQDQWWTHFGSPELNRLMDAGMLASPDIRSARARLDQARAAAAKTGSSLWPALTGEGDGTRTWSKSSGRNVTDTDAFSLGLAASYEVDLWGRVRSLRQADTLEAAATADDLRTAAMTVQGSIAEAWFSLCATRRQLAIIHDQQQINADLLSALELRFANSLASALDVLEQRETIAQTDALVPPLKAQEQELENTITLLLGRLPGAVPILATALPEPMELPALGLPTELLANRPDIHAARLRLEEAGWDLAAARADQLPALRLSGRFERNGDELSRIFDNWVAALAASLTGPIFDGGALRAEVRRQEAIREELLVKYEKTVLTAMSEVDILVGAIQRQQELIDAQTVQLDAARAALESAQLRYAGGIIEYATVLSLHLKVQQLERTLVQQQASLLGSQAGLCRAIGRGWQSTLPNTPSSTGTAS